MLQSTESAFVVIAVIATSLAFLFVLDRCWPSHNRRKHNEAFAWQVNFLGVTYGVIISFMLFIMFFDVQDLPFVGAKHASLEFPRTTEGAAK